MAQFSDTYNAVADQFGDTTTPMITRIKRFINWTQQDIAARRNWEFLLKTADITTVASTSTYSLASDADKVIDIINTTTRAKLGFTSRQEFDARVPYTTSTGSPSVWIPAGRDTNGYLKVQLYLTPDAEYTLPYWYRKRLTDLSADADVSLIPLKYHKLLYLGAVAQVYEYDTNPMANNYWVQYENMINDMIDDLESGSEDSVISLRSTDEGSGYRTASLPPDHFSN